MDYEWDKAKARSNRKKHGASFADAVVVLEDEQAITVPDDNPNEERFITIGMDAFSQVLVVVYTWRGEETIRIISARKATRAERQQYEEG
jgi:uncharacterized DUF497 family protein